MNRQPCNRYLRKIKFLGISRESNHHSKRSCRNVHYNLQTSGDCHQTLLRTTCGHSPLLIERFSHILPYFPRQCMNISVILASLHQIFCHTHAVRLFKKADHRLPRRAPPVIFVYEIYLRKHRPAALTREHAIHIMLSIVFCGCASSGPAGHAQM